MRITRKILGAGAVFLLSGAVSLCRAEAAPAHAVASAHALATRAGVAILQEGGNAFDAAVAVSAALAVVEPYSSGFGGGGFWLLHRAKDGKQIMLDGRETAPGLAHRRMYQDEKGQVLKRASLDGPLAAGIPGMPAAIAYLAERYGRLPLSKTLAPAQRYAKRGFKVSARYHRLAAYRAKVLRQFPASAEIFLRDGEAPPLGQLVRQKDLARTIAALAERGRAGFYSGAVARRLVEETRKHGGLWRLEDLKNYRVVERRPITTTYQGMRVVSAPPPSSGGIALAQSLSMLSAFDLQAMGGVQTRHHVVEALRRAYRDRAVFLGDPDFVEVPVERLLARSYLAGLALTIDSRQATPSAALGDGPPLSQTGMNTTHFSVMDKEGNRVAATLSINTPFGSGFVAAGTGVLLNNEMDDFSAKPDAPNAYGLVGDKANAIAPEKRPLSSMTPTFLETPERVGILGTPGGSRIISMVLLGALDFAQGNLPDSWVNLRRYHHQYLPDQLQFEKHGLTEYEQKALADLGHQLKEIPRRYGNMHAILWDKKENKVYAASDPRGEGLAEIVQ